MACQTILHLSRWTSAGTYRTVNFGCFAPSRCQCFHCNIMRKATNAHKSLHTIQLNEHTPVISVSNPGPVWVKTKRTRMHSSRMRTARLLTVSRSARGGGLPTSLEADPLVMWPVMHAGKPTPTPVNRMTHRCKNITLLQTSFAGGKNITV